MSEISERITSIRESVGREYKVPPKEKLLGFCQALWSGEFSSENALSYLHNERALGDETIRYFHLGYDKERDAIAIPIFKNGSLVNIKYRFLSNEKQRYTTEAGAETWLFHDYGIREGLSKGGVLVVEGEFDCMSAWQAGFTNVVSPGAGKDSYGVWLELLDKIPKVYVAFDNDTGGKDTSIKFAERVGIEKTLDVQYPDGIKDANDYFKKFDAAAFRSLLKRSTPFYQRQFKGVGDIIRSLRENKDIALESMFLPGVKIEKNWLIVASGKTNSGKTTWALNVADEISERGVPVLVMPFERGIEFVGKRFLQVKFDKTLDDFSFFSNDEWDKLIDECVDIPLFMAMPKKAQVIDTIKKAKRLFNIKFVIVDHLDYIVRKGKGNYSEEIAQTLQEYKQVAEEQEVIMLIITHTRKTDMPGTVNARKPGLDDLKGSSSLSQDPECVIMLSQEGNGTMLEVDVIKNKGEMKSIVFDFNSATGKLSKSSVGEY